MRLAAVGKKQDISTLNTHLRLQSSKIIVSDVRSDPGLAIPVIFHWKSRLAADTGVLEAVRVLVPVNENHSTLIISIGVGREKGSRPLLLLLGASHALSLERDARRWVYCIPEHLVRSSARARYFKNRNHYSLKCSLVAVVAVPWLVKLVNSPKSSSLRVHQRHIC